jgi:hypothetical protein
MRRGVRVTGKDSLEPFFPQIGHSTEAEPSLIASTVRFFGGMYFHDLSLEHVDMTASQLDDLLGADIGDVAVDDQTPAEG